MICSRGFKFPILQKSGINCCNAKNPGSKTSSTTETHLARSEATERLRAYEKGRSKGYTERARGEGLNAHVGRASDGKWNWWSGRRATPWPELQCSTVFAFQRIWILGGGSRYVRETPFPRCSLEFPNYWGNVQFFRVCVFRFFCYSVELNEINEVCCFFILVCRPLSLALS